MKSIRYLYLTGHRFCWKRIRFNITALSGAATKKNANDERQKTDSERSYPLCRSEMAYKTKGEGV